MSPLWTKKTSVAAIDERNIIILHRKIVKNIFFIFCVFKVLQCTVKHTLSSNSKRKPKIVFLNLSLLNAAQKYKEREHSAILSTFIKLHVRPVVIKIFVLCFFEWLVKTGFTVLYFNILGSICS